MVTRWHWTPLSPWRRVLPAGARCSGQGNTGFAWSLRSPKERCVRHRLPASTAPMVFSQRITLRALSEVTGEALPAAGDGDQEVSFINWYRIGKKIYCNALMNRYFYPPQFLCNLVDKSDQQTDMYDNTLSLAEVFMKKRLYSIL